MNTSMLRLAAVTAAMLGLSMPALAQFSGYYAPVNWLESCANGGAMPTSCVGVDDNGDVTSNAPDSITLNGSNTGSGNDSRRDFTIIAQGTGDFKFDWTYTTNDFIEGDGQPAFYPFYDPAFYFFKGQVKLTNDAAGLQTQSGSISVSVAQGDVIGFGIGSIDNTNGNATLTISNFMAPIPEPASVALMSLGLLGVAVAAARRRRSN